MEINTKIVKNFKIICSNFSQKTIQEILPFIHEECFLPNEIIFKCNSFESLSIYWISKGKGNFFYNN